MAGKIKGYLQNSGFYFEIEFHDCEEQIQGRCVYSILNNECIFLG